MIDWEKYDKDVGLWDNVNSEDVREMLSSIRKEHEAEIKKLYEELEEK